MLRPSSKFDLGGELDELFDTAVETAIRYNRVSASLIQRRLQIGYARAARLLDQMAAAGVIGPPDGSKPREVLIHSVEEISGTKEKGAKKEQDDVFQVPANYKVPKDLKLKRVEKPLWGKQLGEVLNSDDYKNVKTQYPIILGFDENRKLQIESLSDVGNLIVVGNPTSKKENWIDTVLTTLLLRHSPKELRLVLIYYAHYLDLYDGIPHLLAPVMTDFDKALSAYRWSIEEMNRRMKVFIRAGVRDIDSYNQLAGVDPLPRILIVSFYFGADIETTDALTWLTGSGFKTGIHLFIVANRVNDQNISSDVKSSIPARAVFSVTSAQESKYAGVKGAENLEVGEMLFKQGNEELTKLTTIFSPEVNVKEVVEAAKQT